MSSPPESGLFPQAPQSPPPQDEQEECVICLTPLTSPTTLLPCTHALFHHQCIYIWSQMQYHAHNREVTCPICRHVVSGVVRYNPTYSGNPENSNEVETIDNLFRDQVRPEVSIVTGPGIWMAILTNDSGLVREINETVFREMWRERVTREMEERGITRSLRSVGEESSTDESSLEEGPGESRGGITEIPDEDFINMIERETTASHDRMIRASWQRIQQQEQNASQDRDGAQRYYNAIVREQQRALDRMNRVRERLGSSWGRGSEVERIVQAHVSRATEDSIRALMQLENITRYDQASPPDHLRGLGVPDGGQIPDDFNLSTAHPSPRDDGATGSQTSTSERVDPLDGSDQPRSPSPLLSQRGDNTPRPRFLSRLQTSYQRRRSQAREIRREASHLLSNILRVGAERAAPEAVLSTLTLQDEEEDGGQTGPAETADIEDGA